jgi:hypothetical protein
MSTTAKKQHDPWSVVDPGFERWEGPRGVDDFQPLDTQASDLAAYLLDAMQQMRPHRESTEAVRLADGRTAQITQRDDGWELTIHLGRDWYRVVSGTSREEVLSKAAEQ